MQIITGIGESEHVTSMQHRAIFEMVIGDNSYILNKGELLEPELQSNNALKIRSGMLAHHGCICEVAPNTYDEVAIGNGSQSMKRIDLVVARYTQNAETKVERTEWTVIQGQPVESNPVAPDYIHGNMQDGDLTDDCPVFEVHLDGIQVVEIKKLLNVLGGSLAELNRKLPVFKRRNSSEAGICTPHYIMIMGTLVLQGANADYRQLFSASDLLSKILKFYDPSISNFDEGKCVITSNNGDGNAAAIHFYSPEWWASNNAYFQYFYPATSSTIRVNYCVHYLKL